MRRATNSNAPIRWPPRGPRTSVATIRRTCSATFSSSATGAADGPRGSRSSAPVPIEQHVLRGPPAISPRALVLPVGLKDPDLRVLAEVDLDPLLHHARPQSRVLDRETRLDTREEAPLHPVGAGAVRQLPAFRVEMEHAAVLEEPSHDRSHADVLRHARHARPQAAD